MKEELKEIEVNLYLDDCGQVMLHCVTDCFPFGTAMIDKDQ